jgi:hypothetical protein
VVASKSSRHKAGARCAMDLSPPNVLKFLLIVQFKLANNHPEMRVKFAENWMNLLESCGSIVNLG